MKNESITYEYIKKLLLDALRELYANDYYYIENNVNERSISARLARYIEDKINTSDKVFGSFNIDCEYNRNMGDPKRGKLFNRLFGINNKKIIRL